MQDLGGIKAAVYGELYKSAQDQMRLINQEILNHKHVGFSSNKECAAWARQNLLDILALGKAQHQFYFITHKGEILTKAAWMDYYCTDILFIRWVDDKEKEHTKPWTPEGFEYYDRARVHGEISDGQRKPLYHRDYFTPSGYFDTIRGTFNIAKPFPVAAAITNRDTSHIYNYISHIGGECAQWLLAWLRMKIMYPTQKTQVVPIIVSRTQGTGKTTFAEVICKGLFGKDNVLVTDQYDSSSRFNADYADALVVCHEEKEYEDKRNTAATLKSRATATTIRKEHKGLDPVYQDSYTEFIMTTNKDVPIKFEDREDQRRFMVMEADGNFTRKTSELADEVFTKLYGQDAMGNIKGIPFVEDASLIAQFKHELFTDEKIAAVQLRNFPRTAAAEKCYTLPRTSENAEIESIVRMLAPFIAASLKEQRVIRTITVDNEVLDLAAFLVSTDAMVYMPAIGNKPAYVAICRPLIFRDERSGKQMAHASVERGIYDCAPFLEQEFGITVIHDMSNLPGGFPNVHSTARAGAAARFILYQQPMSQKATKQIVIEYTESGRIGERLRVNNRWQPDVNGEFETVNEMKPGTTTLENKNKNVQYMDTFLFEADDTDRATYLIETERLKKLGEPINAEELFKERLRLQRSEGERLLKSGIACRLVYSGGKSIHILVRVKDAPMTLEEYKWLHAYMCTTLSESLNFDASTADPARLTRAPITYKRTLEYNGRRLNGTQHLIAANWNNIYDLNWRTLYQRWLDRPPAPYESRNKLVPTKSEYRDAMIALLEGKFWTDSQWNGRRQQCFFPGYRLCRVLGYTHDELWGDNGILDGLNMYYRRDELEYWRSRESSDIISQIDSDVEEIDG